MIKSMLLKLSQSQRARKLMTSSSLVRPLVKRFIAGEQLEDGIAAVRTLNQSGLVATLNHLGENVTTPEEASRAADEYLTIAEEIAKNELRSHISVKLTQLGLDLDEVLCRDNLEQILKKTKEHEIFVRIDMECSAYTQKTLDLFEALYPRYRNVGVVIQSYLRRSQQDVQKLIELGAPVRLVKGAYLEPPQVAFRSKREVDREYIRLLEQLLSPQARAKGVYTAIATHDERIIRRACRLIDEQKIPKDHYEFQMLLGIRRDLQQRLAEAGHTVRIYVSYGAEWYPFLMRRLAERPANFLFILRHLVRS